MSDHTPGPWKVNAWRIEAGGYGIADVHGWNGHGQSSANAAANARLIAKAPEMHTLLRQAVDQFLADINDDEPINGADAVDWLVEFVERAKEVIDG